LLVAVYFLPSFLVVAIGKGQLQNRHPKARQVPSHNFVKKMFCAKKVTKLPD
jgi:hypothetical protein